MRWFNINWKTEDIIALAELIDNRISEYVKSIGFLKKINAKVISYDSTNNIAVVNLPNDNQNVSIYNLSGQLVSANDMVVIYYDGADISKGYIIGDISNRSVAKGATGSFTSANSKTVSVVNGLITSIV